MSPGSTTTMRRPRAAAKNASTHRHQGRQIRHEQMSNPTSPSDTVAVHGVTPVAYSTDVPIIPRSEGRRGPELIEI